MSAAETVAIEKGFANRVAALTAVAGVFPVIGSLVQGPVSDAPQNYLANLLYYDSHSSAVLVGSGMRGIGLFVSVVPVIYLLRAALARGAKIPRITPALAIIGSVLLGVGTIALAALYVDASSSFAQSGGLSYDEAKNVLKGQAIIAVSMASLLGSLAIAFAFVMASLNAMRVGLLTRFMGYIGMFAGVLIILPIFSPLPIVQAFWLLAVAAVIVGRWPGGRPLAWDDGEAHPWPSAAEVRAQAAEARELAESEKGTSKNGKGA